jgi:hypothetical protein
MGPLCAAYFWSWVAVVAALSSEKQTASWAYFLRDEGRKSDLTMKFFTPELHASMNSLSDEEFDRANAEWHSALKMYRANLESIEALMPRRTRELAMLQLHDAEILVMSREPSEQITWSGTPAFEKRAVEFFYLTLLSELFVTNIFYVLSRTIEIEKHNLKGFHEGTRYWLYDEVRPEISLTMSGEPGSFQLNYQPSIPFAHHVLLSDGVELRIPFSEVIIKAVPLAKIYSDDNTDETDLLKAPNRG